MTRSDEHPVAPAVATQDILSDAATPVAESLRRASTNQRDSRAALFAAGLCVTGTLTLLVSQLGWWTLLAGPAYLATVTLSGMLSRGRTKALLAVVLVTASMGLLVVLVKLTGLA